MPTIAARENANGQLNDCCMKVSGVGTSSWDYNDWQGSEDSLGLYWLAESNGFLRPAGSRGLIALELKRNT